ncbi:hypothetical protein G7Y89_g14822 [Cudoniella acicularis]|uniref:Heterokaryon incompatibility domain-containing protein n=1 Tax=Cudoniella acicularis TaxID=354080 RepID=A0A8H4QWV8_9HELO|nr:hypothetical protein G7Y89_g14822 [Cudoniella acicularis]
MPHKKVHRDTADCAASNSSRGPPVRFWQRPSSPAPRLGDTNFRYKDISPTGNEIRLLRILPETTSTIKCELLHTSLDDPSNYTAISYAWGDTDDTRTILLDGREFPVTLSLMLALQRLRSRSQPIVVWTDAICINQGNINERNLQVQGMTKVYSTATTVAIWLGPEAENSEMAVELLHELYQSRESPARISEMIKSTTRIPHFKALTALFDRDYWRRLWVVQEVINARNINVYCENDEVPWDICTAVSALLRQHKPDLIRAYLSEQETISKSRRNWEDVLSDGGPGGLRDLKYQESGSAGLLDVLLYH